VARSLGLGRTTPGKAHEELVAAPANDVPRPQDGSQNRTGYGQRLVAFCVPEAVVDRLQTVEVDDNHGSAGVNATRRGTRQAAGKGVPPEPRRCPQAPDGRHATYPVRGGQETKHGISPFRGGERGPPAHANRPDRPRPNPRAAPTHVKDRVKLPGRTQSAHRPDTPSSGPRTPRPGRQLPYHPCPGRDEPHPGLRGRARRVQPLPVSRKSR